MNTIKSKNLKSMIHLSLGGAILLGTSLLTPAGLALADGGNSGGGGDAATEMRIDTIRRDILNWINQDGGLGLSFPQGLDRSDYAKFMTEKLGIPVSTTHTITGSIIGVGITKRISAVRWGVTINLLWAWILTIPVSGLLGAIVFWIFQACGV